jgi:hypothetical protein
MGRHRNSFREVRQLKTKPKLAFLNSSVCYRTYPIRIRSIAKLKVPELSMNLRAQSLIARYRTHICSYIHCLARTH